MAASILALFVLFLSTFIKTVYLQNVKILNLNDTDNSDHKYYDNKSEVCKRQHFICKSDTNKVCAMRFLNETVEYKGFNNTCFLFLNNLCDYLGHEFHIVESRSCTDFSLRKFINRRMDTNSTTFPETINNVTSRNGSDNATTDITTGSNATKLNDTRPLLKQHILRQRTTAKPKYEIAEAYDDHKCPYSCPRLYSPVCMSVNRGEGKHFKYFTFYNHCFADMYYCVHYKDLGPAPSREYEDVQVSNLGWSFCGAYRYLQFARYSEVISSMGHYGWLAGPYRYSHIMDPHQRIPGHGK